MLRKHIFIIPLGWVTEEKDLIHLQCEWRFVPEVWVSVARSVFRRRSHKIFVNNR